MYFGQVSALLSRNWCTEPHDHTLYKCTPWPGNCNKHSHGYKTLPCPHCAEDEKILTERIEAVAESLFPTSEVRGLSADEFLSRDEFVDALRSLVREIRR